jgi:hypothetical protein
MTASPKRRWLRFGTRTMFAAFTVAAARLGWNVHLVRERKAARESLNGYAHTGLPPNMEWYLEEIGHFKGVHAPTAPYSVSQLREWLGDEPVWFIGCKPGHEGRMRRLFPEAVVWASSKWRKKN